MPTRFALIEYVRRLEEQHHVFATDPARINAALKDESDGFEDKLLRRAQLIDSDGTLQNQLTQANAQASFVFKVGMLLWLVFGVVTAVGLMQTSALNFFYILASILGVNVLMLLFWCVGILRTKPAHIPVWLNAVLSQMARKAEHQSLWQLYREQWGRAPMKWWWGSLGHQLCLASLGGLFLGVVLMLLVRQYTFNWQSTLLDSNHLHAVVATLAWLPALLGLDVPTAQTVVASENAGDVAFSRQWANLLWSSLLVYGILPRLLAWLVCVIKIQKISFPLPLSLPYYQRLKRLWQTRIVDSSADYQADAKRSQQAAVIQNEASAAHSHVVVLDAAWEVLPLVLSWQQRPESHINAGVIETREEQAVLLQKLQMNPSQLFVWVRIHTVPDRGVMRRLNQYADHAQAGMTVCLWQEYADETRLLLWQKALDEAAILWQWETV